MAKTRLRSDTFWNKFGYTVAQESHGVSLSSLYEWRNKLLSNWGCKGRSIIHVLDPKSTKPKHLRKPATHFRIESILIDIYSRYREYADLGKKKLHRTLSDQLAKSNDLELLPSLSTVGRIVKRLMEAGRLHKPEEPSYFANLDIFRKKTARRWIKKERRPKGMNPTNPGDLIQMDGVIVQNKATGK